LTIADRAIEREILVNGPDGDDAAVRARPFNHPFAPANRSPITTLQSPD
jgi:hypothetical protein